MATLTVSRVDSGGARRVRQWPMFRTDADPPPRPGRPRRPPRPRVPGPRLPPRRRPAADPRRRPRPEAAGHVPRRRPRAADDAPHARRPRDRLPVAGDRRRADVVFEAHPHTTCPAIIEHYQGLVGLSIARGFTHQVRELFGGPRGCTHTTALLLAMAPGRHRSARGRCGREAVRRWPGACRRPARAGRCGRTSNTLPRVGGGRRADRRPARRRRPMEMPLTMQRRLRSSSASSRTSGRGRTRDRRPIARPVARRRSRARPGHQVVEHRRPAGGVGRRHGLPGRAGDPRRAWSTRPSTDVGYPHWPGIGRSPLPERFAERMAARFGWHPDVGRLHELADVMQGVVVAIHHLTRPGDGIVAAHAGVPPVPRGHRPQPGRRVVRGSRRAGRRTGGRSTTTSSTPASATEPARLLLLCHPHNPTGHVFTRAS